MEKHYHKCFISFNWWIYLFKNEQFLDVLVENPHFIHKYSMDKFIKTISSVVNLVSDWIAHNPKTSLAILIFVIGFIIGTLF